MELPVHRSVTHRLSIRFGNLARPMAGSRWMPLYGVLRHTGRRSGRTYEIPVVVRERPGGFLIPMPFGPSTQWAKNVIAAGGGTLRHKGKTVDFDSPEVVPLDVAGVDLPAVIRAASRTFGIRTYLRARRVPER